MILQNKTLPAYMVMHNTNKTPHKSLQNDLQKDLQRTNLLKNFFIGIWIKNANLF